METTNQFQIDGIVYTIISENSVAISRADHSPNTNVIIPEYVDFEGVKFRVTKIGDMAFFGNTTIISIVLPDSVNEIGEAAFSCCSNLLSVNIPEGVGKIQYETFFGCESLESLYIPDSVTAVEDRGLWYCRGLKTISIPKHLLGIEFPKIFPKRANDGGQCRSLNSLEHCYVRLPSGEVYEFDVNS